MADAGVTIAQPETAPAEARRAHRSDSPIAAAVAVLATLIGLIVLAWTILYVTKGRFLNIHLRIDRHQTGGATGEGRR